jgi:hypothetical protein
MSLTLTIGGSNKTSLLSVNSLRISDDISSRNTCGFTLIVPVPAPPAINYYRPDIGAVVTVTDGATTYFAGTIDSMTERRLFEPSGKVVYTVNCVDYNQILDRRLVARVYDNKTLGYIVNDIVTNDLSGEGITTTGVQTGPTIVRAVFAYQTVADAFNDLSTLTGYSWSVGYDKDLAFFERSTNAAPFFYGDTLKLRNVVVSTSRDQYRNRQYVRAGKDLTASRVESFKGDGAHKSFLMAYPFGEAPTITVNAVSKTVGIKNVDTGKDWYWAKDDNVLTQDDGAATLTSSDTLQVTYRGLYPILALSEDTDEIAIRQSVEGGSGKYDAIEDDQTIDKGALAQYRAIGLLRKYGKIAQTVEFETDTRIQAGLSGLRSGQLMNGGLWLQGFDVIGDMLVESIQITDVDGRYLIYQVRLLRGEALGGWASYFATLVKSGRKLTLRDNEVLLEVQTFSDDLRAAEILSVFSATALVGTAIVGTSEAG